MDNLHIKLCQDIIINRKKSNIEIEIEIPVDVFKRLKQKHELTGDLQCLLHDLKLYHLHQHQITKYENWINKVLLGEQK